ncbi:MAG TPA: hypothetical protein G4O15_01800 [Dehalococcoidia bacterium]|nr:hypothetical protein [Dehalococcoidia bacterium]
MGTRKEILYFDKPNRANTDEMVEVAAERINISGIRNVVIVYSSGYTMKKFLEVAKNKKLTLDNIVAVTNDQKGTFRRGDRLVSIASISDEKRDELEKEGVKVHYVPNWFNFGEPLALSEDQNLIRSKLAPFVIPQDLRPLDIDAGWDLSVFTIISQGFRVCLGCTVVAVKANLIPENELTLSIGGMATALILEASPDVKTCLVKEIIGFERGSTWVERGITDWEKDPSDNH